MNLLSPESLGTQCPELVTVTASAAESVVIDRQAVSDAACAELERHILNCGELMRQAYARYEQTSCLADRGEAMRYERLQAEAIKARTPEFVAKLEQARGLS